MKPLFSVSEEPLIVARVAGFPIEMALDVLAADDPWEAARALFARDARLRLAMRIASPSLESAIGQWAAGEPLRNRKTPIRALAYLLRMCSRTTPLGICAGVAEVGIDERASLAVDVDSSERRTFTRLDMQLVRALARNLERSDLRSSIVFRTNECALELGGRLYVTDVKLANRKLAGAVHAEQRPVSLKNTDAVAFVRDLCREGMPLAAIAERLAARFDAELARASALVEQLIAAGVLLSEMQPSPLGDPIGYLLERFRRLGASWCGVLEEAQRDVLRLDGISLNERTADSYARVQESLQCLLEEPIPSVLQIDMRMPLTGGLPPAVLADAERYLDLCVRMSPTSALERLHDAFVSRYEGTERLVPLLELIDANTGIAIPAVAAPIARETAQRDALVMSLASRGLRDLCEEIELLPGEIDTIAPPLRDDESYFPTMELGFAVDAESAEAIDAGEYLVVPAGFTFADAGVRSLGRLAHLFDEDVNERARRIAAIGDGGDTVEAELAYAVREDRAYNVVTRPLWYDYDVQLGIGAPRSERSLELDDLWVGIDDDRFFLWSKRLNKRVSIRETHVFGTTFLAPDICRFLSLLRYQGRRTASEFDWGAAWNATYLPRIRVGRVVLSARTWQFDRATFALSRARSEWKMPRFVQLVEEDHRLLIDLDSPAAAELIADQGGERGRMRFVEALPSPDRRWLRGSDGSYAVEFVAQACATRRVPRRLDRVPCPIDARESYGPGSQWVYGKLYLGTQAMDQLIVTHLRPLADELRATGAIDRWFFVRYADPHAHLRVRFRATSGHEAAVREGFGALSERLLAERFAWRAATDTYMPEYERYGASAMDAAERFFTRDSDRVSTCLREGVGGTDELVATAARGAVAMLASPHLCDLAIGTFESFSRMKLAPPDRVVLRELLASPSSPADDLIEEILGDQGSGKLLADLMHMHCNRLGVEASAEARVYALVRAAALGRREREKRAGSDRSAPALAGC